jgi:hypothetical protein
MKKIVIFFAAFVISTLAGAQGTDFSGNWKLNSTKSNLNAEFSFAPKEVKVAMKDNDLRIEKLSSFQDQDYTSIDTLTLDGKECINRGFQDTQKKSTVVWSEDKNSLKITSKMSIGDGGELTIIEVYKIDGGNLIIESNATSSYGELIETMVYDKN